VRASSSFGVLISFTDVDDASAAGHHRATRFP